MKPITVFPAPPAVLHVARHATLAALVLGGMGVAAAAAPPARGASLPAVAVAFPKTYNRVETIHLYGHFLQSLAQCAKVDPVNLRGQPIVDGLNAVDILPEAELLRHMKAGKLQLAQFTTGLVPVAADTADGEPFAVRGHTSTGKYDVYELRLIVRADSPFKAPRDLVGSKIAHSTEKSNSGNLAPRAYFPTIGLMPDSNCKVAYSGGHERSIIGTQYGFWDAAAVASDQFERMTQKGEIRAADFRVIWKKPLTVESWVLNKQMAPDLRERIRNCTYAYRFPAQANRLLDGADRFVAIDADKVYAPVRFVLEKNRTP